MTIKDFKRNHCPICNNAEISYAYTLKFTDMYPEIWGGEDYELDVVFCDKCGMIWSGNPVPEEVLDEYYKNMSKYEADNYDNEDFSKLKMYERQHAFINQNVNDYSSVIEIGAATGGNLDVFKREGKIVIGIEPSERNKIWAKKNYDVDLINMTFNEWYEAHDGNYDLFFSSHSLEHIVDFGNLVEKVRTRNKKYFFIEVPSTDVMGDYVEPYGVFTPEHVNYFTYRSLKRLMYDNGYRNIAYKTEMNLNGENPGCPSLVTLWECNENSADINDVYSFDPCEFLMRYKEDSEKKFKKIKAIIDGISPEERVAVWGTGAHTARLLGMTSLREKNIVRFYDSDPKRKGLKMQQVEILPFSEEDLVSNRISTVLVSTFASESTIKNILQEVEKKINIITLYDK